MPEGSPTIKTKPIKGFGRLGTWLNGLLDDVRATEPRGEMVTNGVSGSGKIIGGQNDVYYIVKNGRLYVQRLVAIDSPTEVTR